MVWKTVQTHPFAATPKLPTSCTSTLTLVVRYLARHYQDSDFKWHLVGVAVQSLMNVVNLNCSVRRACPTDFLHHHTTKVTENLDLLDARLLMLINTATNQQTVADLNKVRDFVSLLQQSLHSWMDLPLP